MSPSPARRRETGDSALMRFVRFWLPGLIVLSGCILALALRTDEAWEGGALLVSAGLSVLLINVLFRLGVRGDRERVREQRAREEYERTGVWPEDLATASGEIPGEQPGGAGDAARQPPGAPRS